jgi:hypothetical protein
VANYLSHSQCSTWEQCPRRWQLEKIERAPRAPSEALILGDAIHQALEADGRALMEDGKGLDLYALSSVFEEALGRRLDSDDPWGLLSGAQHNDMEAKGRAILAAYIQHLQPRYRPTAVEESFDVAIPGAPGWRFVGRLDARVRGVLDIPLIADFKATSKPWPSGTEHGRLQADAYLWADQQSGRAEPAQRVTFAVFPATSDGAGGFACSPQFRMTERTPGQLAAYPLRLVETARQIERAKAAGNFPPNPGPLCGWCSVLSHCRVGQDWLASRGRNPAVPMLPVAEGGTG